MLNSTSIRALASLLILAVPVMASIPSDKPEVKIRIGGAELVLPNTYVASPNDVISLAVTAQPGDLIWAFALPLDANLEWTGDIALTLLFAYQAPTGMLSGDVRIPEGAAGDFLIMAVAISPGGEPRPSVNKIVRVRPLMLKPTVVADNGDPVMLDE